MRDLRFALRSLRRQPLFTLVAVLTLTLGIGANTAIFSLLYQVLLRPLPYRDADRLVFVWNAYPKGNLAQADVSIPDYLDRRQDAPAIEDAALMTDRDVNVTIAGEPERLPALAVTPSFFSTLGREPLLGRAFTAADATPGANQLAILSYALWRSRFDADPSVVGRKIRVNAEPYTVVGVMPADFESPWREPDLLLPFAFRPDQMTDEERGNEFSVMIARLRPDASVAQLNAQMSAIVDRLIDRLPVRAAFMKTSGFTGVAVPLREQRAGQIRAALYLLQAGVLLVLLIACANVANLLLMRATGRRREMAIRTALGAGRSRLLRQLLAEGLALSIAGAAGGLVLGFALMRVVPTFTIAGLTGGPALSLNPAVFGFAAALALLTGGVFGLVPAVAVWRGAAGTLADDTSRGTAGRGARRARTLLVVAEVAVAFTLLVGAGLLVESFSHVLDVDPGFASDRVLTGSLTLPGTRYPDADARRAFWSRLLDRVSAVPGVAAAGVTSNLPFGGLDASGTYAIVGRTMPSGEPPLHARQEMVEGDYFSAMRIPLLEGRTFAPQDRPEAPRVVVIDEWLAKHRFPGESPLGRQLNFGSPRNYTIVGVVGTIHASDLAAPVPEERIYYNAVQIPVTRMGLVVKSTLDPASLAHAVRTSVRAVDPEQPVADVQTMEDRVAASLAPRRATMLLIGSFGGLALVLSAVGIYGVLAFGVAQRTRELGIRQALGADRRAIVGLVLKQGLGAAGAGVALGLLASFWLTRYVSSLLYEVSAQDGRVFAAVAVLLLLVAIAACAVPARSATRIDPVHALREG
jgi:predicted permease